MGYSESDYEIKFWGPIFEAYFCNDKYMLHWGDTISKPCKKSQLRFKTDLRIIVTSPDEDIVDGAIAEVARKAAPKKLFVDRLKTILATECHLNNFLTTILFIPSKEIKNVVFPIVQIMGFSVQVYTLRLANRGLYILQGQASFEFPTNFRSLKFGVTNIINGLSCIESLLLELGHAYKSYQMDNSNSMERIINESSIKKKTPISNWITGVI
ncbi:hypothetical protein INT48_007816 [Thamnidium elegans]|uniref:Uncharacterized protein n=1 Tax=Thamnidium elegans TaxID=101142 RepID=A0A8H7SHY5_9FUNG|nr:hypothetical protein INT48_007816 [Thamnidium elegans]